MIRQIEQISNLEDDSEILDKLKNIHEEIGMIEFKPKLDLIPVGSKYTKIGNFELDILAIRNFSDEIVLLDHDSPDFEMGACASNIRQFLKAITFFMDYIKECESNAELFDNLSRINEVIDNASETAGDKKYRWFYQMMFGI